MEHLSGLSVSFREFVPRLGLLNGSLEGYGYQGAFEPGTNFLQLKGASWLGRRWTATGGDFTASTSPIELPFTNLYFPEISARGFRVESSREESQYTFFAGRETLLSGPRVPYRLAAPQSVLGASALRRVGQHWQFGGRLLRLWSSAKSIEDNPYLFPPDRRLLSSNTAAAQALYTRNALKIYGEASASSVSRLDRQPGPSPASAVAAISWDTTALTVRANYANLGPSYLPVVGYYAGDRRGPFGEVRFRPWKAIELFASASRYANNLGHRADVPELQSTSESVGASALLPFRINVTGQVSFVALTARNSPSEEARDSRNRQITTSLSRPFGRHTLRVTARDMQLAWLGIGNRQRSVEIEDHFSYRRFTIAGAVRAQGIVGPEHRNSIFARGSGQARFGRLTAHAFFEGGKDLVNESVFAIETLRTTTAGASLAITKTLNLTGDVFRYTLVNDINLENAFVLGSRGIGVATTLAGLNRWNFYFRMAKTFSWGGPLGDGGLDRYVLTQIPLAGIVEGFVGVQYREGVRFSAGIPVRLDESRTVFTGEDGRFHFSDVPEGPHKVGIAWKELPAEYDAVPGEGSVVVQPRRVARADLGVFPLTRLTGAVKGPDGSPVEDILIRLLPTDRYTTTDSDGAFSFENLREGDYELEVDSSTLPQHAAATTPMRVPVSVHAGRTLTPVEFRFEIRRPEKPVRKVFAKTT